MTSRRFRSTVLARWEFVERLHQQFWKRWTKEYLTQLQSRSKWKTDAVTTGSLDIGKMVVLAEDNLPPPWKIGRIVETHPGDIKSIKVRQERCVSCQWRQLKEISCFVRSDKIMYIVIIVYFDLS
jgi:hypothetical protein